MGRILLISYMVTVAFERIWEENSDIVIKWHVGDVIKKLREMSGLTQEQLAEKAKMSRVATLISVEKSGNYERGTLEKIARGLGLSVPDLLTQVPTNEIPKPAPTVAFNHNRKLHEKLDAVLESNDEDKAKCVRIAIETFYGVIVKESDAEQAG